MSHEKEVLKYCSDIKKKIIPSGRYTNLAVKRFMDDIKRSKDDGFEYEFIHEFADEIIDFAETLIIPDIKREDGTKNLILLPWMKFIYYNLFGWVHKLDHTKRRFRASYVEVARKNSKTTSLLFPILLYDFLTTDASESYFITKDGAQASKSYRELLNIIHADKELNKHITDSVMAIVMKTSRISFFTSESAGTDSYKNSMTIVDEFHSYDTDKTITSARYGGRARKNSLVLIITSAGNNIDGPCYAENLKSKKILNGVFTDETFFSIIYAYDEDDDWKLSKNFIKANPSLGTFLKKEILEIDLNDALITPSHQPDFMSKTCGIWTAGLTSWIPLSKWDTNKDVPDLVGLDCYGAFDLSSINDFTAYTQYFKIGEFYYAKHRFYIPQSTVNLKFAKENINIKEWIDKGLLTVIPGETIDYAYIYKDIVCDSKLYNIKEIAFDTWQSNTLTTQLENETSLILVPYSQSLKNIGTPTKSFEKAVLDGVIVDPNPIMKWMVTNVFIKPDVNGNYKPLKETRSGTKRIDGVITSIMAFDRLNANSNVEKEYSFADIMSSF